MEVVFGGGRRELMHKNQTDPEYPDKKETDWTAET